MSRTSALYRGLFALVFLPVYYLVLYPLVFFAGVLVTAIAVLYGAVTGSELERKPRAAANAWTSISQPVTWIFSGRESDKPHWIP